MMNLKKNKKINKYIILNPNQRKRMIGWIRMGMDSQYSVGKNVCQFQLCLSLSMDLKKISKIAKEYYEPRGVKREIKGFFCA